MEETISKDNILISRKKAAQERRLQKKREKRELPTRPSRTRRELKRDQERDQMKKKRQSIRDSVQAKRALIREQTRERERKYRERQTQENNVEEILGGGAAFPNRTSKKRTTDKVKTTLPASPAKKAAVLESLVSSPRTRKQLEKRGVVTTPEEQREVAKLKAKVDQMHEFTDGCAVQYNSRHCVGDLSCSLADFGFIIQRNYLKTSHAKGEQDAAGSHVKQKVSQAVLARLATINSAKAMHKFLTDTFTQPAASSFTASSNSVQLKRRVSFYVPGKGEGAVIRSRPGRKFKEVKGTRKLHCIKSGSDQEKVLARQSSCYCISCLLHDEENCSNKAWLDNWKEVLVSRDGSVATTRHDYTRIWPRPRHSLSHS